jgi:hypothetical protein
MYHNNIVLGGFHDNIRCRKGMDFSCLQNIADGGEVDENEKFETDEVTSLVPAKYPPNESCNSSTESDKYGHNAKELNTDRNGVLQFGNEPVKIVRNVERVKQTVQNVVELYPTEENVQSGLDLDLINETAEKLVDLTMSEVRCEETNIYKLCEVTEVSPRNDLGLDLEDPRTPEVIELQHEEQLVPETEQECGVHHTENLSGKMDQSMKLEGLRQPLRKKRRKSASNNESVSQSVSRPLTTQPSCDKLQKVRDAVERAIRVSITNILYRQRFFSARNFNLPTLTFIREKLTGTELQNSSAPLCWWCYYTIKIWYKLSYRQESKRNKLV